MKTYAAFLRGVNVGGRNTLPMNALTALLEDLGCRSVATYIQSGNVVLRADRATARDLPERLRSSISDRFDFEPRLVVLDAAELARAVQGNPFPDAESRPSTLHVGFLSAVPPNPNLGSLESKRATSERFALKGGIFYLSAPGGIGRSKLAAAAEKLLGVPMTLRNWRTVCTILRMAEALNASSSRES